MALHPALIFGVLGMVILALRSDQGFTHSLTSNLIGGEVARRFIPIAIVVPLIVGWLIWRGYLANIYDINIAFSLILILLVVILLGLIKFNVDILNRIDCDRKREEAELQQSTLALRESEELFHTLADNMAQLAWMADATGWIFWYNCRWFEYTGTTMEDMKGWGWQKVHHPEHLDRVVGYFRHHLETGQKWEDTFPLRGRDGTYRWFLSRAIPIVDESGQILRWFGTNTDTTEQQATLQEREQAQAAIEERNRELDSFVHVVSHDLKAPLRAIANLSQWIEEDLEGVLTKDTQSQMVLLRSRVNRMVATIDGLLNYARIGRSGETIERVSVAELLAETIDSLAPPPTFTISIPPNLPTLYTHRLSLSQVFSNLINNGIKHHDRSDGSIYISCQERGNFYEFVVADDGPGIASEYHDKIFMLFQAVNPQMNPDSTGIGLNIVKKIIEAEGGLIRLESELGKGTTFYFNWPKHNANANANTNTIDSSLNPSSSRP